MKLTLKKLRQEGDLAWEYNPLHNIVEEDGSLADFETDELDVDLNHPLEIECQPSYDGTVNLIINDDKNPPRIINSRFTKVEDNRYRVITRNQKEQTNLYKRGFLDRQTRLIRTSNKQPKVRLKNVAYFGQLKGGKYTFYIKLADNDYNKTDIVAESGPIEIFKGTITSPSTVSGTLLDERTDKSVSLSLTNLDTSFSKIYLYASREFSDINGYIQSEVLEFPKPYDITGETMTLTINGFEDTNGLTFDDLNIKYLYADAVKTQTQVQNRLFFGNVEELVPQNVDLQNISYYINVSLKQGETIGNLGLDYRSKDSLAKVEYYNPQNTYYKLGYWPDEIYRLGIVYIMNNDELSPVYNLRGHSFNSVGDSNYQWGEGDYGTFYSDARDFNEERIMNYLPKEDFLSSTSLDNTYGVFKNPQTDVITPLGVQPLYYKMEIRPELLYELKKRKVKGFFFVRQKRIPTILGQGLELGVNKNCYLPMLWNDSKGEYAVEKFISEDNLLTTSLTSHLHYTTQKQSSGLLSLDPLVNNELQGSLDGSEFVFEKVSDTELHSSGRHYSFTYKPKQESFKTVAKALFVQEDTPLMMIDDYGFSTKAGLDLDVSQFTWLNETDRKEFTRTDPELARGIFSGFIGTTTKLPAGAIYNVKITNFSESHLKDYFNIRGNDVAPFYAITDRYALEEFNDGVALDAYRGDCYANTVTIRLNRNFVDPTLPIYDTIIDNQTWSKNYKGYYGALYKNGKDATDDRQVSELKRIADHLLGKPDEDDDSKKTRFYKMNRADINGVPLGIWVTFKCLSNYHLDLRAQDKTHADEAAKMGNARTFYPLNAISTKSSYKIPETTTLNQGYCTTLGRKYSFVYRNVPYVKDQFDNRIMFSHVQVDDQFKNGYRIFQSLSYRDIDRQYGAIVKMFPWEGNLLCIFEHGIGLVPVNPQAVLGGTAGQAVHLYGAEVLPNQIQVISQDFGSTWADSVIKTPIGIYGVDTDAKKIWRFSSNGFEILSDMVVQSFLNRNILLKELDKYPTIAKLNVKSHYNNFKGDVMFTFYSDEREWNLCYNERQGLWVTRYSWTPLYSANINNIFWSTDKQRASVLATIYDNRNTTHGLLTTNNTMDLGSWKTDTALVGYELADSYRMEITEATGYKLIDNEEVSFSISPDAFTIEGSTLSLPLAKVGSEVYYMLIEVKVTPKIKGDDITPFTTTIGVVRDYGSAQYDKLMRNALFVHGKAGKFDEMSYDDASFDNQILPCRWYNKQEPFEFEFVVNGKEIGYHKIFNNLAVISNNVQPGEFEFTIEGDAYEFNKEGIFRSEKFGEDEYAKCPVLKYDNDIDYQVSQKFENCTLNWDTTTNQYSVTVHEPTFNIKEVGRVFSNIHYKEDKWYLVIDPLKYKKKYKVDGREELGDTIAVRPRDKYMTIRVKYSGKDLAIISAIETFYTISYS